MAKMDAGDMPPDATRDGSSSRRDSTSSRSSEAYTPLPPGHWTLNVHGNCSRCHHHHSSARIKVNVHRNPHVTTHVRCQGCRAKWLAIGGLNQTRLSLLSVNSITPDPATINVQHSLVEIVRSVTAVAALSPSLARIVELPPSVPPSRQQSFRVASTNAAQTDVLPESQSVGQAVPNLPASIPTAQHSAPGQASTLRAVQPSHTQRYGLHTGRRFSNLKETLALRFPALHRANWAPRIGNMRQPRFPATRTRGQAARTNQSVETSMAASQVPVLGMRVEPIQEEYPEEQSEHDFDSLARPSTLGDTAIQFLETLANDSTNLGALNQTEKAAWVRSKYTEFKNRSLNLGIQQSTVLARPSIDIDLMAAAQEYESDPLQRSLSHDLIALGSRHDYIDGPWPAQVSIVSDNSQSSSSRMSEAETAVEGSVTAPTGPRFSWPAIVRRERSNSPRPSSVTVRTLQHLRRSGEIQY